MVGCNFSGSMGGTPVVDVTAAVVPNISSSLQSYSFTPLHKTMTKFYKDDAIGGMISVTTQMTF